MTLVLTINGPDCLWLLADRRLSYERKPPRDDARKVMAIETTDGIALLGYAGLGATALGTEPADWMNAVLRGSSRKLTIEQSLAALAEATKRQFPNHMKWMNGSAVHTVIVPAFVGDEARLYSIDLIMAPDRKSFAFRHTRHVVQTQQMAQASTRPPRLSMGGSGSSYLINRKQDWIRGLLRVVRAHSQGKLAPMFVADHLARLNYEVHGSVKSVGPNCIVVWRNKRGASREGGGHVSYTGTVRDGSSPAIPLILDGMDEAAFINLPFMQKMRDAVLQSIMTGEQPKLENPTDEEINAQVAKLPKSDESLR